MPLIIGVAGAIATGKSSACELMVRLGAHHCDADKLVHRLYDPGTAAFDHIVDIFGRDIVGPDGFIDRRRLGAKVFGKPDEMKKLTTAIGNIRETVQGVIDAWNAALAHADVALLEAVNLFEAGYAQWCHQTWLVACAEDIARQRLMDRNGFTLEEANQRLASQRPWQERAPGADLVLHNNSDYEEFASLVRHEFARVRGLWGRGELPRNLQCLSKFPTAIGAMLSPSRVTAKETHSVQGHQRRTGRIAMASRVLPRVVRSMGMPVPVVGFAALGMAAEVASGTAHSKNAVDAEVAVAWFDLLYDVVKTERVGPPPASRVYGISAVALVADAFISCWYTMYAYNLLRPVTYIQKLIDDT